MKNQRSKSTQLLKRVTQDLIDKQNQLLDLKDRISRSKPILETIYEKVKRKQELYRQKISKSSENLMKQRNLLKEYKKLYEQSLKFIKKGNLIDHYAKQPSNYMLHHFKKPYHHKNPHIDKTISNKSIYEQYRERINKKNNLDITKKPQIQQQNRRQSKLEEVSNQAKKLTTAIANHIRELKQVKERSQGKLKKSYSEATFKPSKIKRKDDTLLKESLRDRKSEELSRIN